MEVLFSDTFTHVDSQFDPHSAESPFAWQNVGGIAHFADHVQRRQHYDHVSLVATPYSTPGDPKRRSTASDTTQAFAFTRSQFNVSSMNLAVRATLSCQPTGVQRHPFPSELVRNALDDTRLAGCSFGMIGGADGRVLAETTLSSEGIWASYTVKQPKGYIYDTVFATNF